MIRMKLGETVWYELRRTPIKKLEQVQITGQIAIHYSRFTFNYIWRWSVSVVFPTHLLPCYNDFNHI